MTDVTDVTALGLQRAALPFKLATAFHARLTSTRLVQSFSSTVIISIVVLFFFIGLAALAPVLAPYDGSEQHLLSRLRPPVGLGGTSEHILGADHLGRDVLSRLLSGLGTTLLIAGLGVLVGMAVGGLVGLVSGSARGWVDGTIMLVVDAQAAVPLTLLTLTAAAIAGTGPLVLILIVGLADFGKYVRVVRAEVIALRERPFVEAARALGASPSRIAFRHILPNLVSPLTVLATINFSHVVVLESALSFLGVGVQPPHTSLGQMVGGARNFLISHWWLAAIPAGVIVTLTMTISVLGDWLRDLLDPDLDT